MRKYFMTTDRLGFSVWNPEDLQDALELWGDPTVTKFITAEGRMSKKQVQLRLENEIQRYDKYQIQYWPVYLKETGNNIGCCGLRPYDEKEKIFEMGVHLKKQYWGQGFAAEASFAVIQYAFDNIEARGIFAGHNPKNAASAALLKKLGFKYAHDEFYPPTGLQHPSYLMMENEYTQSR